MSTSEQSATLPQVSGARRAARFRNDLAGYGFVLPFLIAYGLFLLWPIVLGLRMSFFNWSLVGKGTTDFLGLRNYRELFGDPNFWSSLWHTVWFTILSTPPLVILGFAFALLVNRAIPAKWFFRLAFFAPYVLPSSVIAIVWSWMYQPGFGFLDNYLSGIGLGSVGWLTDTKVAMISIVIATVWWTIGFNFILYLAGLQEIPAELYEASAIDGAGAWQRIRYITVPLLRRTTTLIVILQVLASLKVFDQIYLLTAGGPNYATRPIIEYIYDSGFTLYRVGFASAMSYVFFVIILVISVGQFVLLNRRRGEV